MLKTTLFFYLAEFSGYKSGETSYMRTGIRKIHTWQIIVMVLVLLIVLVLFLAPRIGRKYVVSHSTELIGRELSVEKLRINYFTGVLRIEGFTLFEQDGSERFISFSHLKVDLDYFPLFRNELFIDEVWLDALFVRVWQEGEKFNFSDLIPDEEAQAADSLEATPGKEYRFTINNIAVDRGFIEYTDRLLDHTIALDTLDLLIPGFSWSRNTTDVDFDFGFVGGGGLHAEIAHNQHDSTYFLNLRIDSLNLDIVEPYLQDVLQFGSLSGHYSHDIDIVGSLKHLTHIHYSGKHRFDDFRLTDPSGREAFSFETFEIDIDTLDLAAGKLSIAYVYLWEPVMQIFMEDSTNNWTAMLPAGEVQDSISADTVSANSDSPDAFPAIRDLYIGEIAMTGGSLMFEDKTSGEVFYARFHDADLSSEDISQDGDIRLILNAELNTTAHLTASVELRDSAYSDISLALDLQQFRLSDIDPYMIDYFGFPVAGGIMNFTTRNTLQPESVVSDNQLYLRKVQLGDKVNENAQMNIPLPLALGILSDRRGIIDLEVPVEMDRGEAEIGNLGKIILRAFGNVFIKAATSPYTMLAQMFDTDPEKIKHVALNYFEGMPTDEGLETLDIIALILSEKPELAVEIKFNIDSAVLGDNLAVMLATKQYFKTTGKPEQGQVPDSVFLKYLSAETESLPADKQPDRYHLSRRLVGETLVNTRADSLISAQYDFIEEYMLLEKEIDSTQISFTRPAGTSPPDSLRIPGVEVIFRTVSGGTSEE